MSESKHATMIATAHDVATRIATSPATLRVALARLARGTDDYVHAASLLVLLRAAASTHVFSVVELSSQEDGATLATIEDDVVGLWSAELLPVTLSTVEEVLASEPELARSFARRDDGSSVTLAALAADPLGVTPIESPSLELLTTAGLFGADPAPTGGTPAN